MSRSINCSSIEKGGVFHPSLSWLHIKFCPKMDTSWSEKAEYLGEDGGDPSSTERGKGFFKASEFTLTLLSRPLRSLGLESLFCLIFWSKCFNSDSFWEFFRKFIVLLIIVKSVRIWFWKGCTPDSWSFKVIFESSKLFDMKLESEFRLGSFFLPVIWIY